MTHLLPNVPVLHRCTSELNQRYYTILRDSELGLPAAFRRRLRASYFSDLQKDMEAIHRSRWRAMDRVHYARRIDGGIELAQAADTTLMNANSSSPREYKRVRLAEDPEVRRLVAGLLALVPPASRRARGDFSLHAFRTRGTVTETVHRDGEDYAFSYVVAKKSRGGVVQLCQDKAGRKVVFERELRPGEILGFDDRVFYHFVSPLNSCQNFREALVMTVDAPHGSHGQLEAA